MDHALRVMFEYDDDRIELRSIRRIAMRVPRSQPPRAAGQSVELRDAEGQVLYRRHAEVIPRFVEYPTGNADRPFDRVRAPSRGVASVLVPVHERARSVAVVEARPDPGVAAADRALGTAELVAVDLEPGHYEELQG